LDGHSELGDFAELKLSAIARSEAASGNKKMELLNETEPCCVLSMYSFPVQGISAGERHDLTR
jgi:hypothetical protein